MASRFGRVGRGRATFGRVGRGRAEDAPEEIAAGGCGLGRRESP